MAATIFRLRRSLSLTPTLLHHPPHLPPTTPPTTVPPFTTTTHPNPNPKNPTKSVFYKFISSRAFSSRGRYDDMDGDQISPDAILFEGCDYNHWLITMDFPKDPKPSPEEMVEAYVQTAAKVLGSVEEAKKKIYACSTTTYNGFQVEVSEEVSEQFKGLPGVVFVLPDSYIDPVNKEYGGDKYINGTIIPRPPPVQYGRQGGRYNDRNREYNRPPRGQMEQNNAPGGQGSYQGDRRGPMPSYQSNYNQGEGRNASSARPTDFPQRDQGGFTPPPVGDYNQGGGGSFRQGAGGQYGQGRGGEFGQGAGGGYGQGTGGQFGQGGGGGQYGQGGGGGGGSGGGQYAQGTGGQYGQGGCGGYGQGTGGQGGAGNYGQGTGGQYGQGGAGNYGQGTGGQYGQGGSGSYGQGTGGQYGQVSGGNYGQRAGGQYGQGSGGSYGQGMGSGYNQTSSQYGEPPKFSQSNTRGQQGNYEVAEEAQAFNER